MFIRPALSLFLRQELASAWFPTPLFLHGTAQTLGLHSECSERGLALVGARPVGPRDHSFCLLVTDIDLDSQCDATCPLDLSDRAVGGHVVRPGLEFLI
jgi:hypothetical protein